jgi:hypothetical protein
MCMLKRDETPRSYIGYKFVEKTPEGKYVSPVQGSIFHDGVNKDTMNEDGNGFYSNYPRYKDGFFFFRTLRAAKKAQNVENADYFRSRPKRDFFRATNIVCVQCRYWGVTQSGTDEVGVKADRALFFQIVKEVTLE